MREKIGTLEGRNQNDPSDAFKLRVAYAEYVRKFPDDTRYLMKAADRFLKMKRYEEAIDYYTMLISRHSDNASALKKRGKAYLHSRLYDRAIKDYEQALHSDSNDIDIKKDLQRTKNLAGIFKDIKKYDEKIFFDPSNPSHYLVRGKLFFLMKEYRAAIWDFSKTVQLKGFHPEALYLRGASYFAVLEFNPALNDIDYLIQKDAGFGHINKTHFLTLRQIIEDVKAFNKAGKKFKMPEFSEEFLDY